MSVTTGATPATAGARSNGRAKTIASLATMDLTGTEDLGAWCELARTMSRQLAMEYEAAAAIVERRVAASGKGGGGLRDRWAERQAIRRTLRPLRAAAANSHSVGDLIYRFWMQYRAEFEPLINPSNGGWKFEEGHKK